MTANPQVHLLRRAKNAFNARRPRKRSERTLASLAAVSHRRDARLTMDEIAECLTFGFAAALWIGDFRIHSELSLVSPHAAASAAALRNRRSAVGCSRHESFATSVCGSPQF